MADDHDSEPEPKSRERRFPLLLWWLPQGAKAPKTQPKEGEPIEIPVPKERDIGGLISRAAKQRERDEGDY